MYFKKAIKWLVYMFCLLFLFSCSTLDDDLYIEKTPQEITIFDYPSISKVDCSETLDVHCKDNSRLIKTEMKNKSKNKSKEEINIKEINSNTSSSASVKKIPFHRARAEKHCKQYDKKAQLTNAGFYKMKYYGTRYLEKYLCI